MVFFLVNDWGPLVPCLLADLGTERSIAVFRLSLSLIIRVKEIMLFATIHSSLDPTFLPCSHTLSFSCSFSLNGSAVALKWEVKRHNSKLLNTHRKAFIFIQTDFYGPFMLTKLDTGDGFCPLDFALLSFLFSPLFLAKIFCIASSLAHISLVAVMVLCSSVFLFMQESSSKTSSFPI